ncbi:IclR family transcriptional regulator [Gordonia otitidis]|uniref:IclR family transcriptional regulator n=1 Tax=Gordonia otitidis TaxID=249058 RepID=UPI001D14A656|nr:IclR family transcriptional regulator [Gordonia otitidis]UEA60764.1 IclR family transcriptional regulator [Gordonia otitidis]
MPGPIQSIQRAAAVLDLLERSPRSLSLREIAAELALPKATVHGILSTLAHIGYVDQEEDGSYAPGVRHSGGASVLDGNVLRSAAMGWCDTLASMLDMQVWLEVLNVDAAEVVHHVFRPDDSPQRMRVGERLPLHASAGGKLLLAYSQDRDRLLRNMILDRFTSETVVSRTDLTAEIATVRQTGLAIEHGEYEHGTAAAAVPLHGRRPGEIGALVVVGPPSSVFRSGSLPRNQVIDQMRQAATSIDRELGVHR